MADYIERETAVDFAQHAYNEWNLAMAAADGNREINLIYKRQELCKAVKSVFSDMPAADVVPAVHGKWVKERDVLSHFVGSGTSFHCSVCGMKAGHNQVKAYHYCPRCSAKMEEDPHK